MEFIFKIKGEVPAKKNSNKFNTKSKVMYKDPRFVRWHESSLLQLNIQKRMYIDKIGHVWTQKDTLRGPLVMSIYLYHEDERNRDADNQETSLLDLLQDAEIISNDNWKVIPFTHRYNYLDKDNPRAEVHICQI